MIVNIDNKLITNEETIQECVRHLRTSLENTGWICYDHTGCFDYEFYNLLRKHELALEYEGRDKWSIENKAYQVTIEFTRASEEELENIRLELSEYHDDDTFYTGMEISYEG